MISGTFTSSRFRTVSRVRFIFASLTCVTLGWILTCSLNSAVYAYGQTAEGGDASHGEALLTKRCGGCHSLDNNKEGPRLRGVFGRKAASVPGFKYSPALSNSGIVWDADKLNQWLTDTDKLVPDNDMDFHVEKADERRDIIAYLKSLSDKP